MMTNASATRLVSPVGHLIIGAGIIGLTTAIELLRHGVPAQDIALVDAHPISGASRVAGGMLAPVAEVQYGQEKLYPLMVRSAELWPQVVDWIRERTTLPTGYRSESTLVVAADRADATHVSELQAHQTHHGMDVRRITTRQARTLEPGLSPQLAGAVEIPGDHQVNPRLFCVASLQVLEQAGVRLIRQRATALTFDSARCTAVRLATNDVVEVSGSVYVCNGLGAQHIAGVPVLPLRPVWGDLVRLAVPNDQPAPVDRVIRGFVEDRPIYVIPRTDHTIAVGATSREDQRTRAGVDGVYTLLRDAIRIVPGLEECEFIEALAGARPATPDDLPLLGTVGSNVVISTGYFRHGILLSALAGQANVGLGLTQDTSQFGRNEATDKVGIDISACALERYL
ncbi:glycine oxidase ThiO [Auritidibacter ignavus]|uniref:glycine oxidase ThiO n=1 Tax=Auritidibacter ignavus TaxID=678932 RepID=UPI002FE51B4C